MRRRPGAGGPVVATAAPPGGPRWIAVRVLSRILGEASQSLDGAFDAEPAYLDMAGRDRAFTRLLILTVLRRLGDVDALLSRFVETPPNSVLAMNLLRLGVVQLLQLATPAHAALNETVRLATGDDVRLRPLLNAVLRKVAAVASEERARPPVAGSNVPTWLWQSWCDAYGKAVATEIAAAHLIEPPLDITVKGEPLIWADRLGAEALANGTLRRPVRGMVEELPGFAEGAWWVQDVAATLPVRLLGAGPGDPVVELCAAPGGKTMQLAAMGAKVTAIELRPDRARTLHANLRRTGLEAEVIEADATVWRPQEPARFVLLDAPCTATGTIRRHPDVPLRRQPGDIGRAVELQSRLLDSAVAMLAPGGTLVYAVCSLQPEEGAPLIEWLLREHPELARLPIDRAELAGLPLEPLPSGDLRTLPSDLGRQGGMDGFFIARLGRRRP